MARCPGHRQLALRWERAKAAAPSNEWVGFQSATLNLSINGPNRGEGGEAPWDADSLAHAMLGGDDCRVSWERGKRWVAEVATPFLDRHAPPASAGAAGVASTVEGALRYSWGGLLPGWAVLVLVLSGLALLWAVRP